VECMFASALPLPRGVSEVEVAGALAQEPIELVKAETNDLLVPAKAEIVLEGEMRPYERMDEGPMGEFHGFLHGPSIPEPVMRVHAITYRNNPIIPFVVEGTRGCDSARGISCVTFSLGGTQIFRSLGFPVTFWQQPLQSWGLMVAGIPIGAPVANELGNLIIVATPFYQTVAVNIEEVDPFDLDAMLEAIWLKTHPKKFRLGDVDTPIVGSTAPYLTPDEKRKGLTGTISVDATWPTTWSREEIPQKVTFENSFPEEMQEWVVQNWRRLGFKEEAQIRRPIAWL